jgi:mannose-6-phosphate isomerase-like protein (cupin superfamily)
MTKPSMRVLRDATAYTPPGAAPNHWVEHFRTTYLSVGTYSIPAGGVDDQGPHSEEEIYVVVSGRAVLEADGQQVQVGTGSVVFVDAHVQHRFVDIEEDLTVLVLFAPPYSGNG